VSRKSVVARGRAGAEWLGGRTAAADGQSMVEYGVMVALVAVVVMVAVQALGTGLAGVFSRIVSRLAGIG
jgi:pilus assembly protein Flp/PilA